MAPPVSPGVPLVDLIDVQPNSITNGDLSIKPVHAFYATNNCAVRKATIPEGADPTVDTWFVNYPGGGSLLQAIVGGNFGLPPNLTNTTIQFDVQTATVGGVRDSNQTFGYGILYADGHAFIPSEQTATATNTWTTVTFSTTALVSGLIAQFLFHCNYGGSTPNARFLVRTFRIIPTCSSGFFASPFLRIPARPANGSSVLTEAVTPGVYTSTGTATTWLSPGMADWKLFFTGTIPTTIYVEVFNNLGAVAQSAVGVWQDHTPDSEGTAVAQFDSGTLAANATTWVAVTLDPTKGPYVYIVQGSASVLTGSTYSGAYTSSQIQAIYVPSTSPVRRIGDAIYTLIQAVDSINDGFSTTNPGIYGHPVVLRYSYSWRVRVVCVGASGEWIGSGTCPTAATLCCYPGANTSVAVQPITNNFGLDEDTPTAFGVADAALDDGIHSTDPLCKVFTVLPLQRSDQLVPNGLGFTLPNYTTVRSAVAAARSAWLIVLDGQAIFTGVPASGGLHPNNPQSAQIALGGLGTGYRAALHAAGAPGF